MEILRFRKYSLQLIKAPKIKSRLSISLKEKFEVLVAISKGAFFRHVSLTL